MEQIERVIEERLKLYLTHREIRMLISAARFADNTWTRRRTDDELFEVSALETLVMRLAREDSDVYQEHPE